MDTSDTRRVHDLFTEAIDMRREARKEFLDRACAGAEHIRAGVETLLSALDSAGAFLANPTIPIAAALAPPVFPCIGSRIGPYTLRQLIGQGGGGCVFLAEQEPPLRRLVALKLILPGLNTRDVIARFDAERQALALMDHPAIARVLDAGAADGVPYFVMELVKGEPVTAFCESQRIELRDRLALFVTTCQAIEHAHEKGIVHRDLKPSNVLVALQDGRPMPKVIDFGIAKALRGPLTDDPAVTGAWHFMGTPQYMSPEQIAMAPDIDARTDIYSLGALLYEILTGVPPFDPAELLALPLAEAQRRVRCVDPPAPSRRAALRMRASPAGHPDQAIMARRSRQCRGGLDDIVAKALSKDRAARYENASSLAEDVQRWLDHRPVRASASGPVARLGKLARRNRSPLLAALAVVCLAGATGLLLLPWTRGRRSVPAAADGAADVPRVAQPRHLSAADRSTDGEIVLPAAAAQLHGKHIIAGRDGTVIEKWDSPGDAAEWNINVPSAGWYGVVIDAACEYGCGGTFELTVDGLTLDATVLPTNGWWSFKPQRIGAVQLSAGATTLSIRALHVRMALMNVTAVHLVHTVEPQAHRAPAAASQPK